MPRCGADAGWVDAVGAGYEEATRRANFDARAAGNVTLDLGYYEIALNSCGGAPCR
jgi:hypothetical protein